MKSLQEIKEKMASVQNLDDAKQAVASVLEIADAIAKASEKLSTELEAEKNRSAEIERNRAEAQAANDELKRNFETVQAEIVALKAAQVAAQAEAAFNERMASIDEVFELADEDRAFIVEEIKDLNAESFAKWLDKNTKVIRKEKTKAHRASVASEKQKRQDELVAALKSKGVSITIDENDVLKEALASAQANGISAPIVNTIDATKSLKEMYEQEFSESVTIGGKKINQFTKK